MNSISEPAVDGGRARPGAGESDAARRAIASRDSLRSQERTHGSLGRWGVVVLFAIAMAWVEAAVAYYLRSMINRLDPYQATPLPLASNFETAEAIREAATMVMLATVGWLAGHSARTRFAYTLLAFGVWDICYYVFLRPLTGWPRTLLDWDVLFLLPLPWWGPIAAPMSIALLMIAWGTLTTQFADARRARRHERKVWLACALGILLALYVFMADAIGVASQGREALRNLLPVSFQWPLFLLAWALMAAPVLQLALAVFHPSSVTKTPVPRQSSHEILAAVSNR